MDASAVIKTLTLDEIIDDLVVRFIINVPDVELAEVERIGFQVEAAHWYYEDFIRPIRPDLPSIKSKQFSTRIFQHCSILSQLELDKAYSDFMKYKRSIPVCGAIILNRKKDKCVMVLDWNRTNWGFPKGKINEDEEKHDCAVREVYEETGFDITPYLKKDEFSEIQVADQVIRLYFVVGVPEDTVFQTQTRKEISEIKWKSLSDLPAYSEHNDKKFSKHKYPIKCEGYRGVAPFVGKIKHFLNSKR
ncbi:DCP2-domain-containing protein [Hesseltinella vesiculosa]|uniref:DCP2-domain-containing protein n=1 Tax=Hesseltinella vesiculosa TaxID=101127 RepID=A0A1X2G8C9_9FUNG|nr:DCP2-domain-containing protein [Hesseltinella vesiculosa]